jgi:membrane protein DedA with SNARE-associated domain
MPLDSIAGLLIQYKYIILPPLSLLGQPLVGMTSGVLVRLGYLDPFIIYVLLVATAVAGDIVLYFIGYHYGERFINRFGKYFSITPTHVEKSKMFFQKYHSSILLISKITNGMGLAMVILFTAGFTRVPFSRFVVFNLIGEGIWSAMIIAIGYYLGNAYLQANSVLEHITLLSFFVLILMALFGFSRYMRNRILSGS